MARIRGLWITLKSSLWFVPAISVLMAAGLALGLVEQDSQLHLNLARQWPSFFGLSADGSRSILATIAQSVITIAGVAFSITIVALSLAANQYTPRVLRNFMRDTGNQVVLGGLMGVFTYCVVVLRTIQGGETPFIPVLSVLFALLLALMAIGFFIYFIHHVATTIQAAAIISAIAQETGQVISSLLPEKAPPGTADCDLTAEEQRLLSQNNWHPVYSAESGYLQSVDSDGLVEFARKHGVTIKLQHAIGEFAIEGKPLGKSRVPDGFISRLSCCTSHTLFWFLASLSLVASSHSGPLRTPSAQGENDRWKQQVVMAFRSQRPEYAIDPVELARKEGVDERHMGDNSPS